MPNCRDESDEFNCKILALKKGYNQRVPPVGTISNGLVTTLKPIEVNVSMTLFKVVAIEEEDHYSSRSTLSGRRTEQPTTT